MGDTENDVQSPTTDFPVSVTDSPVPDDGADQKPVVVHIPRVAARTITGPANVQNQGAIDWGYHGLLAYGSNYAVVVVDTKNIQPIQCLDRHKSMVNKVLWQPETPGNAVGLASSDTSGHIVVWDVAAAEPKVVLQDGTKPILDMSWLAGYDAGSHMLAAIHPPSTLLVWDTRSGTKVWKKMYAEVLLTFDLDPFNPANIAFLCPDCILIAEDVSLTRPPPSLGRKFYVSSPRGTGPGAAGVGEERQRTADRLRRLMRDLTVAEAKPKPDDSVTAGDCLQLRYHRSARHHLLALFARELVVLDLHIGQAVAVVPLEKTASPFLQVVSARQRDVLFCLHESGSVSAKLRRRANAGAASPMDAAPGSVSSLDAAFSDDALMESGYEQRCASEVVRLAKGCRVLGMALNPCTERHIALVASTGKLVFVELAAAHAAPPPLWTDSLDAPSAPGKPPPGEGDALEDLFGPLTWEGSAPAPPLRLPVVGMLCGAAAPLTALRMCPPLTTRNWLRYRPLMAAATATGIVQIYDMAAGVVHKELAVHSCVVRGIEWTGLHSFLSHGHAAVTGGQVLVRNELMLTNTLTGNSVPLRLNKGDEPPIEMLRVSTLKQYFIVIQKDGPFELWDLRKLCMLRTMPKKFPNVVALEWSPIHNLKSMKKRTSALTASDTEVGAGDAAGDGADRALSTREHFVFSDIESQLYHFSVEGNTFRDGIKIPPEAGVGAVTCLAFKNDQIVQADADGALNMWDLRARTSRNVNTGRGAIKKMRFAPGKGNLKLLILYNDGVDVVDLKHHFDRIAQLRTPKDMVKILDIDWAASDKPVLATQDGCLRIMDMSLTTSSSPIADYEFQEPVFCPVLLPPPTAELLQLLLSWQPKRGSYGLDFSNADGFTSDQLHAVEQQLSQLDESQRQAFVSADLGTARRSLLAARLMGDASGADFWAVALYYLRASKEVPFGTKAADRLAPLDTGRDVFADGVSFTRRQLDRAATHESKRRDHAQTRRVVEQLVLLGEMDRAVRLLLETDIAHPAYYADAVKACLVATIQASGAAQSTIKLVATNLIANGSVPEGVQLLCLIGKGLDASRYLLSYAMWDPAVWLAKVALPPQDANEVLRKWAEHLWASGQKEKAVLAALATGRPHRVLEMLVALGLRTRAVLYRAALEDFGVAIDETDEPTTAGQEFERVLSALGVPDPALAQTPALAAEA